MAVKVMQRQLSAVSGTSNSTLVSINAAFLQEIKDVHTELWDLLEGARDMCKHKLRSENDEHRLAADMEELRDLFALQFSLEEGFGYFDNPAFVDMNIAKRAEDLKNDHQYLYCEICEICDWIDKLRHHRRLPLKLKDVDIRFESFCDQLMKHEARENELIFDSFNNDIGSGD